MTESTQAVIYAAKSTEDKHGSIPTQIEDCQALAEREGWQVAGTFSDESFSAFSGNRGPDLERAKELAISIAAEHGSCVLVAQDADASPVEPVMRPARPTTWARSTSR